MGSEDEGFEDTDLHVAVRLGDLKATEEALKSGCNPDEIGLFDWSALHEAAYNGDIEIIKLLLEFGADPNKTDNLNCNTAVHYACIEKQAECLELFLTKGGDPSIKNKDGKTSIDLTEDTACRRVFSDRGFDIKPKEKPLKSILKDPVYKKSATQKLKTLPRPQISKQAPSTPPRPSRPSNHVFVDASSPASSDSGRHSPERRLFSSSKEAWDEKDLLSIPGSPARSQGSSYGSLLSLGSSSCSGADDNAGEFIMSFQYNSKTKQFKVRIWEVLITSLLSTAKIAKDTSLQLYLKTTIVPDQEYQPNPALRRKSEVFRLNPSENNEPVSENQSTDMFVWKGKEARLEFKNSLTLVYEDISKELVATSSLDISISVKRKKSFMTSKHKQQLQDPVLASVNLYMKEAVRKLMKDKYETQRHDIPGITRQAFSLDSVVTDNMRRRNGIETSSAPLERIRLRSLEGVKQTAVNNRCASDGDVHEIPGKNLRKSTQSVTSDVSSNVWLEDPVTESSSLESVTSHVTTPSPQVEVKISSQLTYNEPSFQMQMPKPEKTKDALHEKTHRGRNLIQKSRQKIRSTGHGLIPSSMKSSVTVVTAMDEEERSVGSPSEEIEPYGAPYISNLANRQHSYSTGSLVEVDESPSPSRYRRQNRFASTPDKRRYKPEHYKSSEKLGSRSIAVQMDPKDKNVSISMEKLAPRAEMKHSYGTSYNRRKTSETSYGSRPSILRKLVYDETTFVPNEMNNPCFVND